jgi:hypothetical protein
MWSESAVRKTHIPIRRLIKAWPTDTHTHIEFPSQARPHCQHYQLRSEQERGIGRCQKNPSEMIY